MPRTFSRLQRRACRQLASIRRHAGGWRSRRLERLSDLELEAVVAISERASIGAALELYDVCHRETHTPWSRSGTASPISSVPG